MSDSSSVSARVLELADEFLDRYRRGERPPLGEYTARYPELAGEIREVFPAMAIMERIALADESIEGRRLPPGPSRRLELRQLGDFRILREVGRGGMGVVYEAEQVSLGRHVALKVLPDRLLADPKQRGRFEREAKAAARLHHTNIVPVFGVGEDDGTPYYSMQFIAGLGLDQVISEVKRQRPGAGPGEGTPTPAGSPGDPTITLVARSLLAGRLGAEGRAAVDDEDAPRVRDGSSPPEPAPPRSSSGSLPGFGSGDGSSLDDSPRPTYWRGVARIGSQVADALAYAHSQGILHRDIKPSNLLIDAHGIVWVTDFGLAKVEDQEGLTHTGDILGTLRYMPPEAFEGRHDARGDVYSLGLSLYEMLAFRPAFDEVDRHRLVRQVAAGEPLRLRTINPEIPRDLETVIHKAIEREPSHRYQTAAALAEDLRRYMEDRPILARRASESEKLRRWCRRNPTPAGLLATLFLVFWAGFGLVAWKWREAVAERQKAVQWAELAERQRGRAEDRETQAIEAVGRFRDAITNEPDLKNNPALEALRKRLLGEPLAFFKELRDRLQADQDTRPESLFRLANAGNELGELTSQIGDKSEALIAQRESLAIARKLVDDHPEVAKFQGLLAEIYSRTGNLLGETGKLAEAHEAFESALAISRKLAEANPSVTKTRLALAGVYFNLGNLLRDTGNHTEAREAYESALAISQAIAEANPSDAESQSGVVAIYNSIGVLLRDTGKGVEGLKAYESALAVARKLTEAHPSNGYYQAGLAASYLNSGAQLQAIGKPAEAMKSYESGLAISRKLAEANPSVTEYQSELAACYVNRGIVLRAIGEQAEAMKSYESALAIFRKLAQAYPSVTKDQHGLASTNKSLGNLLRDTGKPAEALKAYESALAVARKQAEAYPSVTKDQSLLAEIYNEMGKLLGQTGKLAEAREAYESALAILRKLAQANPSVTEYQRRLASCYSDVGTLLSQAGDLAEAMKSYESALAIFRELAEANPSDTDLQNGLASRHLNLARLLSEAGKPAEALKEDESGLAILRNLVEANPSVTEFQNKQAAGYLNSGVHLNAIGKPAEALKAFESALATYRELAEANPSVTEFQTRLASSYNNLGLQLSEAGKPAEARKAFESALPIFRKLAEEQKNSPDLASNMGAILDSLAQLDLGANRFLEARERYREAIVWQRKALAVNPSHPAYSQFLRHHLFNLRLAAQRLNDPEGVAEAERELSNLRDSDPSIIALDARLAAILKGDLRPDGEADRLALAQRAYEKALHATAAHLLSEALTANPALANDRQAQPRYNAACFAAMAGCGKGKDDPPPDDDARVKFRKQALDWLNLELAAWSKIVKVGPPQARPFVIQVLTHWKEDPDLAGIRDAEPMEKLADEERAAFQKLWTDVDTLLKKVAGGQ